MNLKLLRICVLTAAGAASGLSATAAEWSDSWIGYRYGTRFREPFNNENISKNIVSLTHVSSDSVRRHLLTGRALPLLGSLV